MLGATKSLRIALIAALTAGLIPAPQALAASGCSATVNPGIVTTGAEARLQFDITNTGTQDMGWIQIQRPTPSYTVTDVSQAGWQGSTDENGSTLTGGTIAPGSTATIVVLVQAGPLEEDTATWIIRASAGNDGSDMFGCDGAAGTTIMPPPQPPIPAGQSDITVSAVTPTSATVSWKSNVASTSYVYFGDTSSYGRVATGPGSGTSHSIRLTGLSARTLYHFMVAGTDSEAHNLFSSDNTLMTPAEPLPPPSAAPAAPSPNNAHFAPMPNDTAAPTIVLNTALGRPFPSAPDISGTATDNGLITAIRYSTDGGQNWLPAAAEQLGTHKTSFRFTPYLPGDGNYVLVVEATDSNHNTGTFRPGAIIIDRLPPRAGPPVITFGPETILPDAGGHINAQVGTGYHITTSAVGGVTSLVYQAKPAAESAGVPSSYTLAQTAGDGLWNGEMSFGLAGMFELYAVATDGAGNTTTQLVMTTTVNPAGRVSDASDRPISSARLAVYYYEPTLREWGIWNGGAYHQTNPQLTRADGSYGFTLPAGKYYLKAEAPGYRSFTSDSFSVTEPWGVSAPIKLSPADRLVLGPLKLTMPDWDWHTQPLPTAQHHPATTRPSRVGQALPDFDLPTLTGARLTSLKLLGRPADVVILTTWATGSQGQLPALADAQTHQDITIAPVFSHERAGQVSSYLAVAGVQLAAAVDPDGTATAQFGASAQPVHVLVDRSGRVKKVVVGVLSKSEILNLLGGL